MNNWYEITPVDTLFFRGSEPLESGQLATSGLFPPPVSVIQGALRTAVLKQKRCSFYDYNNNNAGAAIESLIGKSGEKAPFKVTAVLLKKKEIMYAPAPFIWFVETEKKPSKGNDYYGLKVLIGSLGHDDALSKLAVRSSAAPLPLVKASNEAISLGGLWVRFNLLSEKDIVLGVDDILSPQELYATEPRTGIALDANRKVIEGKLYSAEHVRLNDGVTIVVAINKEIGIAETGTITLGGEQRASSYSKIAVPMLPKEGHKFTALSPVRADESTLSNIICSGKPVIIAGWDMAKGFHKPSETWLPAGSVFTENINGQCVPLAQ